MKEKMAICHMISIKGHIGLLHEEDGKCLILKISASGTLTGRMGDLGEQTLEAFFYGVGQFCFDTAKDMIEKEREHLKAASNSIWSQFITTIIEFASAEKLYFSLSYVERKLLRRDALRQQYDRLLSELKKLEGFGGEEPGQTVKDFLAQELIKQFSQFITARQDMTEFYAKMAKCKWNHQENHQELVHTVEEISERYNKSFHHPILDTLKTSFSLEVEILHNLFKAELQMQEWRFFPSLLLLYESQAKLSTWNHLPQPQGIKEMVASGSWKMSSGTFGTKKGHDFPILYQWLYQLHLSLVSKFSLYFHTTLSAQTSQQNEMKALTAKTSIDYFARLSTFIRKSDAFNVSIILDTNTMQDVFTGHGYHLPNVTHERPRGMDSYPAIVSLPEGRPKEHWPNVISMLTDRIQELNTPDRVVYFYDQGAVIENVTDWSARYFVKKVNSTYYLIKTDVRMTLVAIFNTKKKERDSYVQNFLTEIRALLGHDRLYQMLKPGQSQKFLK